MSNINDSTKTSLVNSSIWGIARGISVHALIYPLEVIKIRQQCHPSPEKCAKIAQMLFQQEGMRAFYKGLQPQLLKTSIKQSWAWPMITGVPTVLSHLHLGDTQRQGLT